MTQVKDDKAGGSTVYVVTNEESARACPSCGVFSTRLKDYRTTAPRHLSCGGRPVMAAGAPGGWKTYALACLREPAEHRQHYPCLAYSTNAIQAVR